jgi:hypothetical protein
VDAMPPTLASAIELVRRTRPNASPDEIFAEIFGEAWPLPARSGGSRAKVVDEAPVGSKPTRPDRADRPRREGRPSELSHSATARSLRRREPLQSSPAQTVEAVDLEVLPAAVKSLVEAQPEKFALRDPTRVPLERSRSATWPSISAELQTALTHELAATRERYDEHRFPVGRGVELGRTGRGFTIAYELERDVTVSDGAQVQVEYNGVLCDGEIISLSGSVVQLWVQAREAPIPDAVIVSDASFLLQRRRSFLESLEQDDFDAVSALSLFDSPTASEKPGVWSSEGALALEQEDFVRRALTNPLTWLWGPPGTGKTTTLAYLLSALATSGKRALFVSNTNTAVDTALLSFMSLAEHREVGEVLRIGEPALEQVRQLDPPVAEDQVAAQAGDQIAEALVECKLDLGRLREKIKSGLARIEPDGAEAHPRIVRDDDDLNLALRRDKYFEDHAALAPQVGFLIDRRRALQELLDRVNRGVVDDAHIVFATVHRCYLNALRRQRFDFVIIDEASMVSTDLAVLAAGRSDGGVVIAGDFRQLGPIAIGKSPEVARWLKRSPFESAGIPAEVASGHIRSNLVALRTQHRMRPLIERLVSDTFYPEVGLRTGRGVTGRKQARVSGLTEAALVLVDTSALQPWMGKRSGRWSRYNLIHAQIAAAILTGVSDDVSVGIVSPFTAQASLFRSLVGRDDHLRTAATVHRFQGGERDVLLWDMTEGRAGKTKVTDWEQVIVLADLQHVAQRIQPETSLRRVLDHMERQGALVDATSLVRGSRGPTRYGSGTTPRDPLEALIATAKDHVVIWTAQAPSALRRSHEAAIRAALRRGVHIYVRSGKAVTRDEHHTIATLQAIGCSVLYLEKRRENLAVSPGSVLTSPGSLFELAPGQPWLETLSTPFSGAVARMTKRAGGPTFEAGEPDQTCPAGHPRTLMTGRDYDYTIACANC